jgi:hypothetical protein
LSDAYLSIGRELAALVAPVDIAWQRIIKETLVELHDRDKSHPNAVGSDLAACVFIATLLKSRLSGRPLTDRDFRTSLGTLF